MTKLGASLVLNKKVLKKKINKKQQARLEHRFRQALEAQQKSNWRQAEQAYRNVLSIDAAYLPAYINLGVVYRQLKQPQQAKSCYQTALEYDAQSVQAWFNLGNLRLSEQDWQAAEEAFKQVLKFSQTTEPIASEHTLRALAQLATLARQQGNWSQVINNLQQLLQLKPENSDAHLELGNAYRHLGQNQAALEHYQNALNLAPQAWKMHYSLARLADQLGYQELFARHYKQALKFADSSCDVHFPLAQTRVDNGDLNGAIEQYRLALTQQPNFFPAKLGLASALMAGGQVGAAQTLYQQLAKTNDVQQLSQLAREIWTHKFFVESVDILKRMVVLRPDLYDTHLNLAKAYSQTWEFSKAIPCIEKCLEINPACVAAKDLLADIYLRQGRCDESAEIYEEKLQREGFDPGYAASLLFTLLYSNNRSAKYKAQRHKDLMQNLLPQQSQTFTPRDKNNKRLKIAYLSADYRDQHPVGLFITPVLKNHDRKQFVIYAYYNNRTYDSSTEQIKALTDQWYEVSAWTDERLQQQIIRDEIDILVDLSGQTGKNRLRVFALRAAPIQLTWLGYPHSTGLESMDYLIADPITCPAENDHLCTEQVYRLSQHCVFCYPVFDNYPQYQREIKPTDKIIFGSFNNLTKVNADTLNLWVKLLMAIPQALLYLKTPSFTDTACIEQFYQDFAAQGISRERLRFSGPCSLDDMMNEYLNIDIGLDPIPYNGGTTTMQALWMGVPVITLAGDNFCGRMGASIMHFAGLSDWVANSTQEYLAIAQQKAAQPQALSHLKCRLREQLRESPLFDNEGFTRELEQAYQSLWRRR